MTDVANLDNIEVVKGDAEIKSNENGSITWDAKGADIYYRGKTTKSVPVDVEIRTETYASCSMSDKIGMATVRPSHMPTIFGRPFVNRALGPWAKQGRNRAVANREERTSPRKDRLLRCRRQDFDPEDLISTKR